MNSTTHILSVLLVLFSTNIFQGHCGSFSSAEIESSYEYEDLFHTYLHKIFKKSKPKNYVESPTLNKVASDLNTHFLRTLPPSVCMPNLFVRRNDGYGNVRLTEGSLKNLNAIFSSGSRVYTKDETVQNFEMRFQFQMPLVTYKFNAITKMYGFTFLTNGMVTVFLTNRNLVGIRGSVPGESQLNSDMAADKCFMTVKSVFPREAGQEATVRIRAWNGIISYLLHFLKPSYWSVKHMVNDITKQILRDTRLAVQEAVNSALKANKIVCTNKIETVRDCSATDTINV